MAKNSIRDYDSSSSNNSDVQSVDISEGCSPSGINNAIREVMADLADVNEGTVALESPKFDSIKDGNIKPPDASGTDVAGTATTIKGGAGTGTGAGGSIVFQTADGGSTGSSVNAHATAMTITDDGSIDINGNDLILDADGDSKIEAGTDDTINIISGGTTGLTVDSSGRVLKPQTPCWALALNSNFNPSATGTYELDFDRTNVDNTFLQNVTESSGQISVPVAGKYAVNFNLRLDGVGSGYVIGYISKNGSTASGTVNYTIIGSPSSNYHSIQGSDVYDLDANDYVSVKLLVSSDTSWTVLSLSRFSGFLIG